MAKSQTVSTQFCVIPRKSIKLLAESVGISCLSSEAAEALAEDVTYRIRETVQAAVQFVKHNKRDNLTGEDINRTLFWSHVEPIYGYGSKNSNIFSSISTKDGDIYFHEDNEVNLRELTFSEGLSSLNELGGSQQKISVEVSLLDKTNTIAVEEQNDTSDAMNNECSSNFDTLSPVMKSYYHQVTRSIIHADKSTVKVVLAELRDNPRVQVFLPYLVNFITVGIKSLSGCFEKLLRLFALTKALADNRNLYLEPYIVQFVRAVMHCLIEEPASQSSGPFDEWMLRNTASQILCHIDKRCSNATNYLHHHLLRTFKDIYEDNERPLHSQYGAIIGLCMLDIDAFEQTVLPRFKIYAQRFESLRHANLSKTATEMYHILDALKNGALLIFRNKLRSVGIISLKDTQCDSPNGPVTKNQSQPTLSRNDIASKPNALEQRTKIKDIAKWYKDISECCGEAFTLVSGNLSDFKYFVQCRTNSSKTAFSAHRLNRQSKNILHTRTLIQHALESAVKKDRRNASAFSPAAKRRRPNRTEQNFNQSNNQNEGSRASSWKCKSLVHDNSVMRFEKMIKKNSTRRRNRSQRKIHVGKCRNIVKRTPLTRRKYLYSLSVLL